MAKIAYRDKQNGFLWVPSVSKQKSRLSGGFLTAVVRLGLAGAEHVTAIAHVIVRHEQLTGKSLKVKKAGDALGNIVEHAKLIGEVLGEIILAVPSAAVTLAEIREIRIAVARDIQKRPEGLLLVIIEVSVLENALERGFIEAALTVPLIGVILIIEVGKLGILLITVQPSAGGHKIIVAAEGVQVKPHASLINSSDKAGYPEYRLSIVVKN